MKSLADAMEQEKWVGWEVSPDRLLTNKLFMDELNYKLHIRERLVRHRLMQDCHNYVARIYFPVSSNRFILLQLGKVPEIKDPKALELLGISGVRFSYFDDGMLVGELIVNTQYYPARDFSIARSRQLKEDRYEESKSFGVEYIEIKKDFVPAMLSDLDLLSSKVLGEEYAKHTHAGLLQTQRDILIRAKLYTRAWL